MTHDEANVIRCWHSGGGDDLLELLQRLASSPVDVIVIQYEQDMFGLSALANLITQQKKLGRHLFVTFHATAGLALLTVDMGMLEIRRALKSCDRIFVHNMKDVKNLEAFKVRNNVDFLLMPEMQSRLDKSLSVDQNGYIANYFLRKIAFVIASGGS